MNEKYLKLKPSQNTNLCLLGFNLQEGCEMKTRRNTYELHN